MKKKLNLIFCILLYPLGLIGQSKTNGIIEIIFPNSVQGTITLVSQISKSNKLVIDSSQLKNGKYAYKYKPIDATQVQVLFYPKDSVKAIGIYAKNPYLNGYSDAIILDNHHAVLNIDSLFKGKNGKRYYRGNISGSPETDLNHKILNDWFNPTEGHKITNRNGTIKNFDFIKENANSEILLQNIYNERVNYTLDSLKTVFSLFNDIVKRTSLGEKIKGFIKQRELFTKEGIDKNFVFYDNQSKKYTLKECLNGKPMALIVFWASWCGPCIREIPHLKQLHNQFKDQIAIISISVDEDKKNWSKALKDNPVDWLNLSGFPESATKVMDVFGISAVPCFIVVDESGNLLLDGLKSYAMIPEKDSSMKMISLNNIDQYFNDILKDLKK